MCDLMGDWEDFSLKYTGLVRHAQARYPDLVIDVEDSLLVSLPLK